MKGMILVVEDNPTNMKLMVQALGVDGYTVLTSENGDGLVEQVAAQPVDLVLMDIQLTNRSGVDLLRDLRADPRTAGVPVLAVTAFADPEATSDFHEAGFDQVVTKPISVRHLLKVVASYCRGGAALAPSQLPQI